MCPPAAKWAQKLKDGGGYLPAVCPLLLRYSAVLPSCYLPARCSPLALYLTSTPLALSSYRCFGREPVYVDFEVEPKIDRDNPPDLKGYADAAEVSAVAAAAATGPSRPPAPPSAAAASPPASASASTSGKVPASQASKPKGGAKGKDGDKAPGMSSAAVHQQLADVPTRVEDILQKVCGTPGQAMHTKHHNQFFFQEYIPIGNKKFNAGKKARNKC